MAKHSKQYIAKTELVEKDKPYELEEAVALLKQSATAKFDETVELHIKTGADPRHAEQLVRGVALLPHGLGREIKVLVLWTQKTHFAPRTSPYLTLRLFWCHLKIWKNQLFEIIFQANN